jgi:hypothetical protein
VFPSDYGVAKSGKEHREKSSDKQTTHKIIKTSSVADHLSRQFSGFSSVETGMVRPPISIAADNMMLDPIDELGPRPRANSRKKVDKVSTMNLLEDNATQTANKVHY